MGHPANCYRLAIGSPGAGFARSRCRASRPIAFDAIRNGFRVAFGHPAFARDRPVASERYYPQGHSTGEHSQEIDILRGAFERVAAYGRPEFVLISGYAGIGKSSVINELHRVLLPSRGLFASGKFDQYKRNIPYATLAKAFQTLIHQILAKRDAEVNQWRNALRDALDPNGQVIVNIISELELVIGQQPPVPDLSPVDARSRFRAVFRQFLGVFARAEHPLALFLDDLQWVDSATLDLLKYLTTEPDVRHLLLLGAYRDNEVSASHPLVQDGGRSP